MLSSIDNIIISVDRHDHWSLISPVSELTCLQRRVYRTGVHCSYEEAGLFLRNT